MVSIREVVPHDAASFLELCLKLDSETSYMLLEPGERNSTVEEQEQRLKTICDNPGQVIFVAEVDSRLLIGFIGCTSGSFRRNRHSACVVVGVLQEYAGKGIGTRLFLQVEEWAVAQKLHRLELTVMTHNLRGVGLYKKMGFEIEGTKRDALFVDGQYVDEYYMAKLLPIVGGGVSQAP